MTELTYREKAKARMENLLKQYAVLLSADGEPAPKPTTLDDRLLCDLIALWGPEYTQGALNRGKDLLALHQKTDLKILYAERGIKYDDRT